MIRLHVVAEGQTEEAFVNRVLALHLANFDVVADVRCITTSRRGGRPRRGGMQAYEKMRRDLLRWMKEDRNADARFTTFFDLYKLAPDFPGYKEGHRISNIYERVELIERRMSENFGDHRFVPYIQLHEFEALLLADPHRLEDEFIHRGEAIEELAVLCAGYESPEEIDEGEETAPSKQIIRRIPEYKSRKISSGSVVAEKIGLPTMRAKCPHFDAWVKILEDLGSP